MGKDSGGGDTTVRYAKYIESHHKDFLNDVSDHLDVAIAANPFSYYAAKYQADEEWYEDGFFGAGYSLSDFPSLYDMYGKFMAGLDVEVLWNQAFDDTVNSSVINTRVSRFMDELSDDITDNALPRHNLGMRDINAVQTSTFVIGRSLIESTRVKAIEKYDAELRHSSMQMVNHRYSTHLQWNKGVIDNYMQMLKLYMASFMDMENHTMETLSKSALWPFTVYDYMRVALGALTGATKTSTDVGGASNAAKALGGAMSGAAAGFMIGGPTGAGVGALGGALAGLI